MLCMEIIIIYGENHLNPVKTVTQNAVTCTVKAGSLNKATCIAEYTIYQWVYIPIDTVSSPLGPIFW